MRKAKINSEFWFDGMLPTAVNLILSALDNKKARAKFRSAFLRIFRGIKIAFAGDSDFE